MSSTNRGSIKQKSDYYITPVNEIQKFAICWELDSLWTKDVRNILDPCAGGDSFHEMSYPFILKSYNIPITTVDIREDSRADIKRDYLRENLGRYDLIITNPPFIQALDIIKKALRESNKYVVMLLRLNFFGSQTRLKFWHENMPELCYVHSKRMSFTNKGTDSIEYMHCVWNKEWGKSYCKLKII